MIDLGPHAGFIVAAYSGVAIVTVVLITWTAWRSCEVKGQLALLEAQGIRRRSDSTS